MTNETKPVVLTAEGAKRLDELLSNTRLFADWSEERAALRALAEGRTVCVVNEPVAFRHVLMVEGEQAIDVCDSSANQRFGIPGIDHGGEEIVTPLYAAGDKTNE